MNIYKVLKEKFGYHEFRFGQEAIIKDVMDNHDILAMLPTGTGKSLCYQLPAYLKVGLVVVVSPLLSLMEDQVEQLKKMGEKRVVAYNSFLTEIDKKRVLEKIHNYKLLYISPEALQSSIVISALQTIRVSMFVIDEAHCISQWGHEFRTDYLKLAAIRNKIGRPPCLALTATATAQIRNDIIGKLELSNTRLHVHSIDRPNISINVKKVNQPIDKLNEILHCVRDWEGPGIIYTSSRSATETITEFLRINGISNVAYYHGGMEHEERLLIQRQFLENQLSVICCTNSFGMGVNKSNVRYIIHYHLPSDIGSYLQEIGRAGRDHQESIALLLYCQGDEKIQLSLVDKDLPSYEEVELFIQKILEQRLTKNKEFGQLGQALGLRETALRFLVYQLHNKTTESVHKEELINEIWDFIENRKKLKWTKVHKMVHFVQSKNCRREIILWEYNEQLNKSTFNCCDRCGVDETSYQRKKGNNQIDTKEYNWREELKLIFS
jgi:ATP-dependent DNA helicase RecQ